MVKYHRPDRLLRRTAGFSLIELLIVLAITATLAAVLSGNLRGNAITATARHQAADVIVSDLRRAQSMALSGTRYQGSPVCGYGIHYSDASSYFIYARSRTNCAATAPLARNYQSSADLIVETRVSSNKQLVIDSFFDIFFEPPQPKFYLNDTNGISADDPASVIINLYPLGQSCVLGTNCTKITVSKSGSVDISDQ